MSSVTAPLGTLAFYAPLVAALQNSSNQLSASVERLSSGNRITNAGDDVAALSIATGLQTETAGLTQASSNVAQGSSLLEVASGGLTQINQIITNLQTVAEQASGSALTATQRGFLQQQFSDDLSAINSIAGSTAFNGINLLDGTLADGTNIQAGTGQGSGNTINVAIADSRTSALFDSTPKVDTTAHAAAALTALTTAGNSIQTSIAQVSGLQTAFNAAASSLAQTIGGIAAATSNLIDTDIAKESTTYAQDTLTVNAGIAILAQARNLSPNLLLLLRPMGHS